MRPRRAARASSSRGPPVRKEIMAILLTMLGLCALALLVKGALSLAEKWS